MYVCMRVCVTFTNLHFCSGLCGLLFYNFQLWGRGGDVQYAHAFVTSTLKHAQQTVKEYRVSLLLADVALAILWPVFAIAGIIFQFYRNKNRPPFEIPERHQRPNVQILHRFSGTDEDNVINEDNSDDERTGLLTRAGSGQTEVPRSYQAIPS